MRTRASGTAPLASSLDESLLEGVPRGKEPTVSGSWARIVRSTFSLDVDVAWADVKRAREQQKPVSQMAYSELVDALAETARVHEVLIQLVPNADLVLRRYEADVETLQADMRDQARRTLENEKQERGGKTITDSDVKSRMAGAFPEEYRRQQEMLAKSKGARDFIERLRDSFASRRRELEAMIRTTRMQ